MEAARGALLRNARRGPLGNRLDADCVLYYSSCVGHLGTFAILARSPGLTHQAVEQTEERNRE